MKQKVYFTVFLILILILLGVLSVRQRLRTRDIVYAESLDEVAAVVDDQELTLRDLAFYVAFEEGQMEWDARAYDIHDTGAFWRIHTNHTFLRAEGKEAAMKMAVHDTLFYQMAMEEGIVLSQEEEELLANDQYDFWSDLTEEQRESLGVEEDAVKESMRRLALAEKYQYLLAEMKGRSYEEYSFNGSAYERLLETHTYEVIGAVWDRVPFGSITVDH